jgi:hypothetical protein
MWPNNDLYQKHLQRQEEEEEVEYEYEYETESEDEVVDKALKQNKDGKDVIEKAEDAAAKEKKKQDNGKETEKVGRPRSAFEVLPIETGRAFLIGWFKFN